MVVRGPHVLGAVHGHARAHAARIFSICAACTIRTPPGFPTRSPTSRTARRSPTLAIHAPTATTTSRAAANRGAWKAPRHQGRLHDLQRGHQPSHQRRRSPEVHAGSRHGSRQESAGSLAHRLPHRRERQTGHLVQGHHHQGRHRRQQDDRDLPRARGAPPSPWC